MNLHFHRYVTGWLPLCAVVLSLSAVVQANNQHAIDSPFAVSNRNPFVDIYGLPVAQGAQLLSTGQRSVALQVEIANSFTHNEQGNEAIIIDGETLHTNVQLRYGLSERLELGLDLPYISHDGGSLDGFIDSWHNTWHLPDGDRPNFAKDQLQFSYLRPGYTEFNLRRAERGVGDASITLAYQLSAGPQQQWALRSALKLPTGDAGSLLGSESTDLSLGIHVSDQRYSDPYRIRWHASAGLLWMSEGAMLNELRKDWVSYGSFTLSWQFNTAINMKLQLDAHSAFYTSALTELGSNAAMLTLGGGVQLSKHWLLELAIVEDIAVDTAPDIVFHIGIKTIQW